MIQQIALRMANRKKRAGPVNLCELLPVGQRSPILKYYSQNLRRAFYYANLFVIASLLFFYGYAKVQTIKENRSAHAGFPGRRIILTYSQLGPPPSIMDEESGLKSSLANAATQKLGQPKPVKDSLASQETAPTQQEISGTSTDQKGRLIEIVRNIPDLQALPLSRVEVVPILIKQVKPEYPVQALKSSIQGTTVVEGVINIDGTLVNLKIRISSGSPLLDEAALVAASQYLFTPGKQKGRLIPVMITIPFQFSLPKG